MPSASRLRALLAALPVALLTGCGSLTADQGADDREVVASFYPLAWVAGQVAGEDWTVTNLTTPGGEPHDLELSIGSTAALTEADLVVYLEDFQPAVDDAIETNVDGEALEAGGAVGLEEVDRLEEPGEEDHAEDHAEDDGHDHGHLDPHFWHDPARMAELARAVADRLAELDAAGAEDYLANAEELAGELEALDRDYSERLATCERSTVVVSHDAFGYLEKYGLDFEPIAGLSPDADATPADLARLQRVIGDSGITTVFSERLASSRMADTLAADLGVRTGVLDPVEGLTDETAGEDYTSLMRSNLAALQEANGC